MDELRVRIQNLADEVAACGLQCAGVANSPPDGRPPRGLILEHENRNLHSDGVIVVGQNPGKAAPWEKALYVQHGVGYRQQLLAWDGGVREVDYFVRIRELLALLGLNGSVLWTDVAKCEGKRPPAATLRCCAEQFLRRELLEVPMQWPVVAAGLGAYQLAAEIAGTRPVLGVYHPTGRFAADVFTDCLDRMQDDTEFAVNVRTWVRTSAKRIWLDKAALAAGRKR
jgi:hypothetical protein